MRRPWMALMASFLCASVAVADWPPSPPPGPPPDEAVKWDGWKWVPVDPKPVEDAAKGAAVTAGVVGLGLLVGRRMAHRRAAARLEPTS